MKSIISCGELSRGEYSNIVIQSYLLYEYPKNRSFKSDPPYDSPNARPLTHHMTHRLTQQTRCKYLY